jgi:hypothetical protein
MGMFSLASVLGFLIGMRHAIEPDHIAAVSTIVSSERGARRAARVGLAWGIGHTLALLVAGGTLLVLRLELPGWFSLAAELCVGLVLVGMGAGSIRRALQEGRRGPHHRHSHHGKEHAHSAVDPHVHLGRFVLSVRPLFLGLLHGLAGTGALAAMVLASMPDVASGLLYIAVFGLGSIVGMTILTGTMGKTMQDVLRGARARVAFQGIAGALSLVLGIVWMVVSATALGGR